jgi:hypothetical protein
VRGWLGAQWIFGVAVGCGSPAGPAEPPAADAGAPVSPCADGVPRCPGDRCNGDRCALVRLAGTTGSVFGVDDEYVYWATGREIDRMPKCGGAVEVLALSQDEIKDPRLHGDAIYFRYAERSDRVVRLWKNGGASEELFVDPAVMIYQPGSLTLAGNDAYLGHTGGIVALPLSGGSGMAAFMGSVVGTPGTDGERAYFYSPYPTAGFFVLDAAVASPFAIIDMPASVQVSASVSDGQALYVAFAPYDPMTLYRVDPAEGAVAMTELGARPETVRVDDRCVYVSTPGGTVSGIRRMPLRGGELEMVAVAGVPFAMDLTSVFYVAGNDLYRLPK